MGTMGYPVLSILMLFVQVTVVPLNDGPIVQFNPDADMNAFASLADRSHAVGLIEEGLPVRVMPNTTTVTDVDSTNAGGATVQLSGIRDGLKEALRISKSLAETFHVTVNVSVSDTSFNITLSGFARFEAYKQVRHRLSSLPIRCWFSHGMCRSY